MERNLLGRLTHGGALACLLGYSLLPLRGAFVAVLGTPGKRLMAWWLLCKDSWGFDGSRTRPARGVGLGLVPFALGMAGGSKKLFKNTIEHYRTLYNSACVAQAPRR